MAQIAIWIVVLLTSVFAVIGAWSVDHEKLNRDETANKIFKGVLSAKALAEQNFQVTGRFESNRGYPVDGLSLTKSFPSVVAAAQLPPSVKAVTLDAETGATHLDFGTGARTSSDVYWPAPTAYGIQCASARATDGTDSAAFAPCASPAKGHRYLTMVFSNEDGTCAARPGGYLDSIAGVLSDKAPYWANKLGTDVWVRGVSTAGVFVASANESGAVPVLPPTETGDAQVAVQSFSAQPAAVGTPIVSTRRSTQTIPSSTGSGATTQAAQPATLVARMGIKAAVVVQALTAPSTTGEQSFTQTVSTKLESVGQTVVSLLSGETLVSTPSTINFGNQGVAQGAGTPASVTVTNTGSTVANIQGITTSSIHFVIDSTGCQLLLAPGNACTFSVAFAPKSLGTYSNTLRVAMTDGSSVASVAVTGTGVQGVPTFLIPSSFNFFSLTVGVQSPVRTFDLKNTGAGDLKIKTMVLQGDSAFTMAGHTCPATLVPNATCSIGIQATVPDTVAHSTNLVLATTQSSAPLLKQTIFARARYSQPGISPGSLDFTDVPVGKTVSQDLTLTNYGSGPFNIQSLTTASPFALTSNCPSQMAAQATCIIHVSYTAAAVEGAKGTVELVTDADLTPNLSILLSAFSSGGPALEMSPYDLDFGLQNVNVAAGPKQTLTITNTGTEDVDINGVSSSSSAFVIDSMDCQVTLVVGDSCNFTVAFAPRSLGKLNGKLTIQLLDGTTFAGSTLKGVGVQGSPKWTGDSSFRGMKVGVDTEPHIFTLQNVGLGNMGVKTIVLQGDPAFTLISTNCPLMGTMAAGATCTVSVKATVSDAGFHSTNLVVTTTMSSTPTLKLVLSANAYSAWGVFDATSLDFGPVQVGSSATKSVTLSNPGTSLLGWTNLGLGNAAGGVFSIGNSSCTQENGLVAGGSCTISIMFTPNAVQSYAGSLDGAFFSSAPAISLALSGSGVNAPPPVAIGCPQVWVYLGKNTK